MIYTVMVVVKGSPLYLIVRVSDGFIMFGYSTTIYRVPLDATYTYIEDAIKDAILRWGRKYLPGVWYYVGLIKGGDMYGV